MDKDGYHGYYRDEPFKQRTWIGLTDEEKDGKRVFENGLLFMDNLYFNNLVNTKATLETEWLQPISKSWLAKSIQVK